MQCHFGSSRGQQCERKAEPNWMTCKRHHSAGISRKQYREVQAKKRRKGQAR